MWFKLDFEKYYILKYYCFDFRGIRMERSAISIKKYHDSDYYSGSVYCQEYSYTRSTQQDNDLDVIKFKCLLVAKQMGWNIDSLV